MLDFDCGNIDAVVNMFHRLGINASATREPTEIETASHIVLPGNGAFDDCMINFEEAGFRAPLEKKQLRKKIRLCWVFALAHRC